MRRALKSAARVVGALLLAVVAIAGIAWFAANTQWGRSSIEKAAFKLSDGHIRLVNLRGSIPQHIELERLQLIDAKGAWLTAEGVALSWNPLLFVLRRVQIDGLRAARVRVERAPIEEKSSSTGGSVPRIDLGKLAIARLELAAPLAGTATTLAVSGSAHYRSIDDLRLEFAGDVLSAGAPGGSLGHYAIRARTDSARIQARVLLRETAGGPLQNLSGLPGLGALLVSADIDGPRSAERVRVSVRAGELRGQVSGTADLPGSSAVIEFSLSAPAMTPRPDLSWRQVTARGHWRGSIAAPVASADLQIEELALPGGIRAGRVDSHGSADAGGLALSATLDGLGIPGAVPDLFGASAMHIDASVAPNRVGRPATLSVSHALFELTARGQLARPDRQASVELRVPDLGPLTAMMNQRLPGSATIHARVSEAAHQWKASLKGDVSVPGAQTGWPSLLGRHARVNLAAAIDDRDVRIDTLSVTGRAIALSGRGVVPRASPRAGPTGNIDAKWTLQVADLHALSSSVAGRLNAAGSIAGPPDRFGIDAELKADMSVGATSRAPVVAQLSVAGLPRAPRSSLHVTGRVDGAPLAVDIAATGPFGNLESFRIRAFDWKSLHAGGHWQADRAGGARGQLDFRLDRVEDLNDLAGLEMGGSVSGHAGIVNDGRGQRVQMAIDARKLKVGAIGADAHLDANGPVDSLLMRLSVDSTSGGAPLVKLTSNARVDLNARELELRRADIDYRGLPIRLAEAAKINAANGVRMDPIRLTANKATLEVAGQLKPALDLHASLRGLGPDTVNAFAPGLMARGSIDGRAQLQGDPSSPQGGISIKGRGVRFGGDFARGIAPLNFSGEARLSGDAAQVTAQLDTGATSELRASGRVPLSPGGQMALKITGRIDMAIVNPLLEARGERVQGQLQVDSVVNGTLDEPQAGGVIRVADGAFRDFGRGVELTHIAGKFVGDQRSLRIDQLNARAGSGGLVLDGTVGVLQPGMPIDLRLQAHNARPVVSKLINATLDADLKMTGALGTRVDVDGVVNIDQANIGIPSGFPPNVAVLDVRRPGNAAEASKDSLTIGMNVKVQAPRRILVQGRGLDAELGGTLRVSGTTDALRVRGGLGLIRGSFKLAESRLAFSEGRVTFSGEGIDGGLDPRLDFTATSTSAQVVSTLRITGSASSPEFGFSSSPPLPQDEILSRLLFGQSAADLNALQLAQIGAALASLRGGGGFDPLGRIQQTLGLDRLSIQSGGNDAGSTQGSGTSVAAGRYVSKRVYLEARQSMTGNTQLQVNVDLTRRLKLQTRLGNGSAATQGTTPENDPGSSIGLTYEFEY